VVFSQPDSTNPYALGHANEELERLIGQGRLLGDLTAHFLRLAGLEPGMRVLDVGCGAGDVSFVVASIVGPTGLVTGVDRSPDAVAMASQRAAAAGLPNVRFVVGDAVDFTAAEPVDAVVGRLVLMYFPDPAAVLRRLSSFVRPGGIVTFQDFDLTAPKSEPPCPLFETAMQRIQETFARAGADPRMGLKLGRVFEDAGLPTPQMLLGARVERGPDSMVYNLVTQITRTLLPLMERTGVATVEAVGIDTMADRLREEALAQRATLVPPSLIAAWTRTLD
jgi:predicted O-methyltransferase YrrM